VSSVLLEIIISPLRGYVSFMACMVAGFVLFIILTHYTIKRFHSDITDWKLLLILILGLILINSERFFNFTRSLVSLPDELFHLLGIFVGYAIYKIKSTIKWIILLPTVALCGYMYFAGYGLWLNKLNFGTFTGVISEEKIIQDISFTDSANSVININHLKGEIVLLDFWNSKCGVCYSKFPVVQKVYEKYKENLMVNFYSVNFFLGNIDNEGDAFRIIKDRGYSFPVLICRDKSLLKALKITCYPTVLIINRKGELVFRGNIEDADKKIEELLKEDN
jgi:thiol-disulfide isomerase/thioredoxin